MLVVRVGRCGSRAAQRRTYKCTVSAKGDRERDIKKMVHNTTNAKIHFYFGKYVIRLNNSSNNIYNGFNIVPFVYTKRWAARRGSSGREGERWWRIDPEFSKAKRGRVYVWVHQYISFIPSVRCSVSALSLSSLPLFRSRSMSELKS